ncbi:MAG: ABC transporter ATP-binding protein [Clostridia bacterium]|nr:ABC transporter ATP-binding protein [Clostridia bacterium]
MLNIDKLSVVFHDRETAFEAVDDVSLQVDKGEIVGIVGESGSGKSMTAHALMGLIKRSDVQVSGKAEFDGVDLLKLSREELRGYQGEELSIIFQEPMTSLNPTMKIGKQVEESLRIHTDLSREERKARALEAMELAELDDPERLYDKYPHQLSGGMRQRVMIASAIVLRPQLLIADEPTTALDVTIQAEILNTLKEINRKEGTSILFISHDLGVVRHLCQRVVVMQKGRIVEEGPVDRVFYHPQEEYTKRLIASRPTRKKLKGGSGNG